MASKPETLLRDFLDGYARATVDGDVQRIANAYSGTYLEAGPGSVVSYDVDESYKTALGEKSAAMKDHLGLSRAEMDVTDIREFAPSHFIVEGEWTLHFTPANKTPVASRFRISYVVRLERDEPAILLSVSHEDEEAVMKRDGVI